MAVAAVVASNSGIGIKNRDITRDNQSEKNIFSDFEDFMGRLFE